MMAINIDQITNEVNVVNGELPFDEAQVEKLVDLVLRRLQERKRDARWNREATTVRRNARPGSAPGEGSDPCPL